MNHLPVIIAGSGAAGMMAALTLAKNNIDCLILEKGPHICCSNAARAGGPALANTRLQAEQDCILPADTLYQHMYQFSRGTVNAGLLKNIIDAGAIVEQILLESGIQLTLSADTYGVGFRARELFNTPPQTRWPMLLKRFLSAGGKIALNSEVKELIIRNKKIVGVRVFNSRENSFTEYECSAVFIATGGYLGNQKMLREHFGNITIGALGSALSDGAGINMVLSAGGTTDRNWGICANEFGGYNHKNKKHRFFNMQFAVNGGLLVDRQGKRFMNEQYMSDQPLSLGGEMTLRAGKYYAILDDAMYKGISQASSLYDYYGRPENWYVGKTTHSTPAFGKNSLSDDIASGFALKCDTLEEIACKWDLRCLPATVREYNRACENQKDPQFGKSAYLLKPITTAPFYAFEYEPSAWCTIGGVRTDDLCHALTADSTIIPGLYVAGTDNGSCYCTPYYDNEGACLGIALGSGIVAAESFLQDLKQAQKTFY